MESSAGNRPARSPMLLAGSGYSRPSAIRSAATNGRFRRDEQHRDGHHRPVAVLRPV